MRLRAEFTTEPFVGASEGPFEAGGAVPPHVMAAADVLGAAELDCHVGPFGTSASGDDEAVYAALAAVLRAAFSHGATRVTLQVERTDDTDDRP